VAPPGWASDGKASILKCPEGTYAGGWARRINCTSCGVNIGADYAHATVDDEFIIGEKVLVSPNDCCEYHGTALGGSGR
jgi:hypothetical protein